MQPFKIAFVEVNFIDKGRINIFLFKTVPSCIDQLKVIMKLTGLFDDKNNRFID